VLFAAVAVGVIGVVSGGLLVAGRARLTGDTRDERIACICRLANEQPWGAGGVLAEAAVEEDDEHVRRAAVVALSKFVPDHRSAVKKATGDSDARVRIAAAGTLGRCADKAAAERLGEMLNDPKEDNAVRTAAVAALVGNKSATAIVLLVTAMEKHPDTLMRDHATAALVKEYNFLEVKPNPEAVAKYRLDPKTLDHYRNMKETLKTLERTKEAFAELGETLELRPEYVIQPDPLSGHHIDARE